MRRKDFDILKNAEDDIIEELIPYSSDDEKTKKRVFDMSEKKYNYKIRRNIEDTENETMVLGVEKYRRPICYKPLCAAAAVVLMCGAAGSALYMSRNAFTGTTQSTQVLSEQDADISEEATTEAPALLSEDEMKALFDEYLPIYIETINFNNKDVVNTTGESVSFWISSGEDENFVPEPNSDIIKDEDNKLYTKQTFYKVNNEHFSTIKELEDYYAQYFDGGLKSLKIENFSDFSEGQKVDVTDENGVWYTDVIEYDGALYAVVNDKESTYTKKLTDVISDRSYDVSEDKFVWERVYKVKGYNDKDEADIFDIMFVKCDDGKWRIKTSIALTSDPDYDYIASETPQMYDVIDMSEDTAENYD